MAYPTGWTYKCKLTVDKTKVGSGGVSNFPVLLTEANLPAGIFTYGLNGGGDIRFSSDSAGTTQLACEVVTFDTGTSTCEIWVKVPSIASATDTDFYVWYGKAGESQPAVTDTYGRNAVWSESFFAVYHLKEGDAVDSTGNANTGVNSGSADQASGKIGHARTFEESESDVIAFDSLSGTPPLCGSTGSVSLWCKGAEISGTRTMFSITKYSGGQFYLNLSKSFADDCLRCTFRDAGGDTYRIESTFEILDGTWHFVACTRNGTAWILYDALNSASGTKNPGTMDGNDYGIGAFYRPSSPPNDNFFDGDIDEVHLSTVTRTPEWLATEYNSQNAPSTFITEGSPEPISTGSWPNLQMKNELYNSMNTQLR